MSKALEKVLLIAGATVKNCKNNGKQLAIFYHSEQKVPFAEGEESFLRAASGGNNKT